MEKLQAVMARLREPSSWAAISVVLALVGLPAPVVAAIAGLVDLAPRVIDMIPALAAAGAAFGMKEKGEG